MIEKQCVRSVLSVDAARDMILRAFAPLTAVLMSIDETLGTVLAENIVSACTLPPFDNSAMDGFAVVSSDTDRATPEAPVRLSVIAEAPTGRTCAAEVVAGTTVRIMTGAPMPVGADAVVRFEDVEQSGAGSNGVEHPSIAVPRPVAAGECVRPAGEDVRAGDLVLLAGTVVRPAEIGMLASLGMSSVSVHRRPRVAVLATGDELVAPGGSLGPGQIFNSNTALVAALISRIGGEPVDLGIAKDAEEQLLAKLGAAADVDLIVTTGGVSVGDYDLVKDVMQREGVIDLWQVRIKPGRPLAFGHVGGVPLIGLPGNPVAAAVAFEQFARPAIQMMLGLKELSIPAVRARLLDRIENHGGRRAFVRGRAWIEGDSYVAASTGRQGSANLGSLVRGNCLIVIPEEWAVAEVGAMVEAQMLDWFVN